MAASSGATVGAGALATSSDVADFDLKNFEGDAVSLALGFVEAKCWAVSDGGLLESVGVAVATDCLGLPFVLAVTTGLAALGGDLGASFTGEAAFLGVTLAAGLLGDDLVAVTTCFSRARFLERRMLFLLSSLLALRSVGFGVDILLSLAAFESEPLEHGVSTSGSG